MEPPKIIILFVCLIACALAADQKVKHENKPKKDGDLQTANSHHWVYPYKGYLAEPYGYPYGLDYGKGYGHGYGKIFIPTYSYAKKYDSHGYNPYYYGYYPGYTNYYPWKSDYFPAWYGSYYYAPYDYGDKPPHPSGHGYYYY